MNINYYLLTDQNNQIKYICIINNNNMSNKNNTSIADYLTASKLFPKDRSMYMYKTNPSNSGARSENSNLKGSKYQNYLHQNYNQNKNQNQGQYQFQQGRNQREYLDQIEIREYQDGIKNGSGNKGKKMDILTKYQRQIKQKQDNKNSLNPRIANLSKTYQKQDEPAPKASPSGNQQQQIKKYHSNYHSSTSPISSRKTPNQKYPLNPPGLDQPSQQQSPQTQIWQSLVINSSNKYFSSCRTQALDFITKMQDMLKKQQLFIKLSKDNIQQYVKESHQIIVDAVKEDLYRVVDRCLDHWRDNQLRLHGLSKIGQMQELNQISTQIDQRYKQIVLYKTNLDNQKEWRNRASDLLTGNYQANLIQLAKMCRKSVENVKQGIKAHLQGLNRKSINSLSSAQFSQQLSSQISKILSTHILNQPSSQPPNQPLSQSVIKQPLSHRFPSNLTELLRTHRNSSPVKICQTCHLQILPSSRMYYYCHIDDSRVTRQNGQQIREKEQKNRQAQISPVKNVYGVKSNIEQNIQSSRLSNDKNKQTNQTNL